MAHANFEKDGFSRDFFYAVDFGECASENSLHCFPTSIRRYAWLCADGTHRAVCSYDQAKALYEGLDWLKVYRSADLQIEV